MYDYFLVYMYNKNYYISSSVYIIKSIQKKDNANHKNKKQKK